MCPPHILPEQLAKLAEGRTAADEADRLRRHLAECERCLADYSAAVQTAARLVQDREAFPSDPRLVARARAASQADRIAPEDRGRRTPRWARRPALGLAALLFGVSLFALRGPGRDSGEEGAFETFVPDPRLVEAVRTYSIHDLLLPGGEPTSTASPRYRSGGAPVDSQLGGLLATLAATCDSEPTVECFAWRTAGMMAAGQLRNAAVSLDEAQRHFPGSASLLVLDGLVSYRQGDADRAVDCLREATRIDSVDVIAAWNLAVLLQRGIDGNRPSPRHLEEAERQLAGIIARQPDSEMAERARHRLQSSGDE